VSHSCGRFSAVLELEPTRAQGGARDNRGEQAVCPGAVAGGPCNGAGGSGQAN